MTMKFEGLRTSTPSTFLTLLTFSIVFLGSLILAPRSIDEQVLLRSVILQIGLVFGLPAIIDHFLNVKLRADFRLNPTSPRNLAFSLLIGVSLIFLLEEMTFLQVRIFGATPGQEASITGLLKTDSVSDFGWTFLAFGLIPAFCEEFLFRGFIFGRLLQPNQTGQAVMLSSVLFGVFHRQLGALFNNTMAGIVLSLIVFRSGSLYNSILAHAVINTVAIVIANSSHASSILSANQKGHLHWVFLAASLSGILLGLRGLRSQERIPSQF